MSYFHNKNGMLTTLSARLFYRFRNGQTERLEKIHKTLKLFFFSGDNIGWADIVGETLENTNPVDQYSGDECCK